MRRRILATTVAIAVLAIGLFAVPLAILVERFVDEDAMLRVERQAILAARAVPEDFPSSSVPLRLPTNDVGIHLGVYDLNGRRVVGEGPIQADAPTLRALTNRVTDAESDTRRLVAVPVSADTQMIAVIRAEQSTAASDARTLRIELLLAGIAAAVLAVGAAVGWVMAGRLARPVVQLRDAAVRLGDGDFTLDMSPSDIPEIDEATAAMLVTAGRLDELVSRERGFSASASHQLRTPLTGLRAALETELAFPRDDREAVLREALIDVERLERTISELLVIARRQGRTDETIAVRAVLSDLATRWAARFHAAGRELVVADVEDLRVKGSATMLQHALDVLVDNALTHGGGTVRVTASSHGDSHIISVTDEGAGFAGDEPDGANVDATPRGLGLPLAARLVDDMSGRLRFSRVGRHPRIDLVLRRADGDTTPTSYSPLS